MSYAVTFIRYTVNNNHCTEQKVPSSYFESTIIYLLSLYGGGCQWRRSVILGSRSRPPLSLHQSSFLPFPLVDSPGGLDRACSPVSKHFDALLLQSNSLIKSILMFNVGLLQKSACVHSSPIVGSTELIPWITGHV